MIALWIFLGYCVVGLLTACGVFIYHVCKGNYSDEILYEGTPYETTKKKGIHEDILFSGLLWWVRVLNLLFNMVDKVFPQKEPYEDYIENGIKDLERDLQNRS